MTVDEAIKRLTSIGVKCSNLAKASNDEGKKYYLNSLSREFSEVAHRLQDEEDVCSDIIFIVNDEEKMEQDPFLITGYIKLFRVNCDAYGCSRIIIKIDIPLLS